MPTIPHLSRTMKTLLSTTADHLAVTTGFVQRASPLTGSRFAQILVFSCWQDPAATCTARADMAATLRCPLSPQAIDQRFTPQAAQFLQALLAEAVRVAVAADPVAIPVLRRFRAVEVCDGSVITLPAPLAAVWAGCGTAPVPTAAALKLLLRFDLCRGRLRGPLLTAGRTHDRPAAQELEPVPLGGLHIGDLAFFALDQLASWSRSGRFWLSRLKRGTVVAGLDGTRWDLPEWLAEHCPRQIAVPIRLGAHHRLRCRLLAERVPTAVAAERRAKLQAAAQREGRTVSAEEWALAAWTLLVTNCAPEQLSLAEGLALEQARWQVELLFKRWKSLGQVDEWRSAQPWRILCEVYAKLLVLVLQHWLLVVGCWANADRSLWRGVQTLQRRGHSLAAAWTWGAWSAAVAEAVAAVARCRIDKRKNQPSTYQVLLAATPPEEVALAA